MAKRELRLAVVIYGGASLAVYMHGVTKELLKLVRASKVLHELGADAAARTPYASGPDQRPHDTEAVYFELLKQINERHHTRVVIDVIAGASAGAINGIMLAKALVDDASLDAHTDLWLSSADADELRGETVSRWRKWYLYPLLRALSFWMPDALTSNDEIRGKLTRLARTSWFRAPFSGSKLCHRLLEALDTMKRARRPNSTLLPPEQRLDVYASITDLFGYPRLIRLHDRLVARERSHGAYVRLSHRCPGSGSPELDPPDDFADDNVPALTWAARASSSYAGAFAPFRHQELMAVLEQRQQHWPGENRFLRDCLYDSGGNPASAAFDPRARLFVDGGIVNNKPFAAALEALQHRPADRQVERVILYVEPDPALDDAASDDQALGYLGTIRAAASSIPRNQPIMDDLQDIMGQDLRARNNRRIVDNNRHTIAALVSRLLANAGAPSDVRAVTAARRAMAGQAGVELGLGYRAYAERRLWRLAEALAEEWAVLTPEVDDPVQRQQMLHSIRSWWLPEPGSPADHSAEDAFLVGFDVSYRIRWVQYVIRRLNQQDRVTELDPDSQLALSQFKRDAYAVLGSLYRQRRARTVEPALATQLIAAAHQLPLDAEQAATLMRSLAAALDLGAVDKRMDVIFSAFYSALNDEQMRSHMLTEYLGFPLYDALLLTPGSEDGGPDPLTELRVERVSPADSQSLGSAFAGLKCRQFMGFLGFFNRGYREHDYLWGRLNGADRVVDLLVGLGGLRESDAARIARRELFEQILRRERSRLHHCGETLSEVQAAVKTL